MISREQAAMLTATTVVVMVILSVAACATSTPTPIPMASPTFTPTPTATPPQYPPMPTVPALEEYSQLTPVPTVALPNR